MKTTPSTFRLIAETFAIVASVECGIMLLLPVIAPGVEGTAEALVDTAMLTLGAVPLLMWRVRARAKAIASQATAQLIASEAEARTALAGVSAYRAALNRHAIVAVTDLSGTITEVNDNFCRISGYSRAELIGANHSILNSGHHPKSFWVDMWRTIAGGNARGTGTPDNARMSLGSDAATGGTSDAPGQEGRVSSPGTRFPVLRNGMPEGGHAFPEGGDTVPEGGDAMPEGPGAVREAGDGVPKGSIWRAEVCNRAKDGSLYWVDTTIEPVRDEAGKTVGFISIRFDISDRKQAVQLLQYSHDNLERHVAERTQLLAEAVETANLACQAKSQFLAHVSHEIRTPINGVAGMLDLLSGTSLDPQQRRFTDLARTSVGNLNSVINDVLDFAKIEAGKLDIVPDDIDLLTVIEDIVQMMAHRAQQKGLEITCAVQPSVPRRVRGDADRVRQILVNLVGNAIKFTTEGVVVVRVVLEGMHGGDGAGGGGALIRFTVSDTGIGIPEDRLERLFKAFSQADASTTRKYGGTGLGLAICKQLAELMGGTIGVASGEGRGSTFWFTIAFAQAKTDPTPQPAREHELWGKRLLVVGCSPCQRDLLVEQCSTWGLRIDEAEDGDQGLAMLAKASESGDPFAVGIVDTGLGAAGPFEFAAAARRDPRLNATALLLQHPMTTPVDPARFSASGFAGDLATPARQSQLLDAMMNAMVGSGAASIASSPAAGQSPPPAASADDRRLRILVAEDNEINQIVAREMLTRAGHDCEIVGNGKLAVEAVLAKQGTHEQYDLVLMDCHMPEMDGYDATREIRRHEQDGRQATPSGTRLPIMALTANAMQGDRERCLEAGMDAHMSKPINPKQLLLTIDRVLRAGEGVQTAA